jgi:HicB family
MSMADKTSDAIKLNLRLPKHLHKRLKQQARRNNVSLNTEIVNQLEGSEAATFERISKLAANTGARAAAEFIVGALKAPSETELPQHIIDKIVADAAGRLHGPKEEPDPAKVSSGLLERLRSDRNQAADQGENSPPVRKAEKS